MLYRVFGNFRLWPLNLLSSGDFIQSRSSEVIISLFTGAWRSYEEGISYLLRVGLRSVALVGKSICQF